VSKHTNGPRGRSPPRRRPSSHASTGRPLASPQPLLSALTQRRFSLAPLAVHNLALPAGASWSALAAAVYRKPCVCPAPRALRSALVPLSTSLLPWHAVALAHRLRGRGTPPALVLAGANRCLTARSTRGPAAGQQAREALWYIIVLAGLPSHRRSRVTSNVRRHMSTPLQFASP